MNNLSIKTRLLALVGTLLALLIVSGGRRSPAWILRLRAG